MTAPEPRTPANVVAWSYRDGRPVRIEIKDGLIRSVEQLVLTESDITSELFVAPGLIDNQINGYASVGFTSLGLTVADVCKAVRALQHVGVTSFLPTVYTNSTERFLQNFSVLRQALAEPEVALAVPGFHLEGPYLSSLDGARGAHAAEWVRRPDWQEFERLNQAAGGYIKQVTLAPELEGALDFIEKCVANGIVVGLGHHNATAETIKRAVDLGAGIATHLGNACVNWIHRHNNPLWPQLAEDRLWASLIVDGFHLNENEIRVFYRAKKQERTILVSDAVRLAGMPPGRYREGDVEVEMSADGVVRIAGEDMRAGSSMPLCQGVANMVRLSGCTLADAVDMASVNPARLNNLADRGEISPGKRADLILFTFDGKSLSVYKTLVAGRVVYDVDHPDSARD